MKKLFALAAIFSLTFAAIYFSSCNGKKTETTTASNEDSVKKVLERGEYLVMHVVPCLDCHSKRDFSKYSGPIVPGSEGMGGEAFDSKLLGEFPGVIYAKNITPDPETGIGTWTDEDILKAMTQGISKTGDTLFPLMPYVNFSHMAKSDLMSIIAYIRTLKPIKNKVPDRNLMVPIGMVYPAIAIQRSLDENKMPDPSDKVQYGGYLANAAACADCHTPQVKGQPDFSRLYAGGFYFNFNNIKINTANITPDSATGIGTWTEERFMTKFTQYREEAGYNHDPGKQNTYMPLTLYAGMTDEDLKSIFAYLKSLKPISQLVEKYPK